jgi:predicted RND superfamily exporter protein
MFIVIGISLMVFVIYTNLILCVAEVTFITGKFVTAQFRYENRHKMDHYGKELNKFFLHSSWLVLAIFRVFSLVSADDPPCQC